MHFVSVIESINFHLFIISFLNDFDRVISSREIVDGDQAKFTSLHLVCHLSVFLKIVILKFDFSGALVVPNSCVLLDWLTIGNSCLGGDPSWLRPPLVDWVELFIKALGYILTGNLNLAKLPVNIRRTFSFLEERTVTTTPLEPIHDAGYTILFVLCTSFVILAAG